MLNHPIWMISPIQKTNVTQIFIPKGEITLNADYATLRLTQNVSALYEESHKLCQMSNIIEEFVAEKIPKGLSTPNKRILRVLQQNIRNTCKDITSTWTQITNSFGLTEMNGAKDIVKRQIVAATAIVTSLIKFFTTKELDSMTSGDNDDELYESTNHIITAIQNHETRLVRMEDDQNQLKQHLEKLNNALIMGIRTQDLFYDMFAASTYALSLQKHVKDINEGLYTLLQSNKLHPNLIDWSELAKAIDRLRKMAIKSSKELLLENNADVFQLKTDFVARPEGIIHVLVHIPVVDISSKLKLFQHIPTPITAGKYQIAVDDRAEPRYLAINQDFTLYATLHNLDKCIPMRDTYIWNDISILRKVGKNSECLIDLYLNEIERAKMTCNFRIVPNKDFAVRLTNKKIYISVTNRTGLTEKCLGKSAVTKTTIQGPNIILIEPGCRIQTSNFIFKRNKNIISEDATPVLIQTEASELWKIITNNPEDEEVTELLNEMMQDKQTGFKIVDVMQKFNLRKVHKTSKITKSVTLTTSAIVIVLSVAFIFYLCRNCKNSQHESFRPRMNIKFSDLVNESYDADIEQQPKETSAVATNAVKTKKKAFLKPH